MPAQWENSRGVSERIFIQGELFLETPANFGNGDTEGLTDIPILFDACDGKTPLLSGTSIAGALRNYLRQLEAGYGVQEKQNGTLMSEKLFGYLRKKAERVDSILSWLMVDDALGEMPESKHAIELRDGVTIDRKTRTAKLDENKKGQKFDLELLAAGTKFCLRFEFWLKENSQSYLEALALALEGFENGDIGLGLRKSRGYGQCRVTGWQFQRYSMNNKNGILNWLSHHEPEQSNFESGIISLLEVTADLTHKGEKFVLNAKFKINSSVLIRSGTGYPAGPDFVHLRSLRERTDKNTEFEMKPVLSGTSLAGVIRHRAQRIALTMIKQEKTTTALIDGMFGFTDKKQACASRVVIRETEIENGIDDLIQTRIKIDRFTGSAFPNALFSEQPLFGKGIKDTRVCLHIELRKTPAAENFEAEVGLLLLVLKDLWTGDLAIGGESSVGRGRLSGIKAEMSFGGENWEISQTNDGLEFSGNCEDLERRFVTAFLEM